jgi:MFS family permease
MSGTQRRALAIVFGVVFLDLLGFSIVIPILPFYARAFGGDELAIGALAAVYSLMQFVSAPYLGSLSDRYGRRPVLVLSLCGSVVAWTVFGLAGSLAVLFLSRGLAGAMGGNIATAQAYVADVTPPEERAKALGFLGAAFGLGFIVGPGVSAGLTLPGVVETVDGALPALVPIDRFSLPAFAAAFASLLAVVGALLFLPESRDLDDATVAGDRPSQVAALREALADPGLRGLVVAFFLFSFAFSGVQVMFIPYVADVYGYAEAQAALLLTYIGVLAVVVQGGLIGPLTERYSSTHLTVFGAGTLAVALLAIPFTREAGVLFPDLTDVAGFLTPALLSLLFVLALLALGNGVLGVTLTALVSGQASADRQGSAFGITQGAGSLARTVGPVLMGALYASVGFQSPFVLGGLLVLPVVAIALYLRVGEESGEARPVDPAQAR